VGSSPTPVPIPQPGTVLGVEGASVRVRLAGGGEVLATFDGVPPYPGAAVVVTAGPAGWHAAAAPNRAPMRRGPDGPYLVDGSE
jgi:hypothetical protein